MSNNSQQLQSCSTVSGVRPFHVYQAQAHRFMWKFLSSFIAALICAAIIGLSGFCYQPKILIEGRHG